MRTGLQLAAGVADAIRAHGVETYPHECCGALVGPRRRGDRRQSRCPTRPTKGRDGDFCVRPSDYQRVERAADAAGAELLGFYHSHPDHPARPSQYDLDHAWPNFSYIIVSVTAGVAEDMRSWKLREDRSAFDEEVLPVNPRRPNPNS